MHALMCGGGARLLKDRPSPEDGMYLLCLYRSLIRNILHELIYIKPEKPKLTCQSKYQNMLMLVFGMVIKKRHLSTLEITLSLIYS